MNSATRLLLLSRRWSPLDLFRSGEQGAWFDCSDFSTLFQDSAGTTPVTAAGQPVGLMLDKRLGAVRGADVIVNGDFAAAGAGWSTGTDTAFATGSVTCTAPAANQPFVYQPALIVGQWYAVTYTISAISGGYVTSFVGSGTLGPQRTTPGTWTEISQCSGNTNAGMSIQAGATATITRISFLPLSGNHATQSTAAARPTLQQDASGFWHLAFDGVDDGMQTGNVDFSATNKLAAFWGGQVASVSASAAFAWELTAATFSTDGGAALYFDNVGSQRVHRSTVAQEGVTGAAIAAPLTTVYTSLHDFAQATIANGRIISRRGGAVETQGPFGGTTVAGNFANAPLFLGRRGGTSNPLQGRMYGFIIRAGTPTATQIALGERWAASKCGVAL